MKKGNPCVSVKQRRKILKQRVRRVYKTKLGRGIWSWKWRWTWIAKDKLMKKVSLMKVWSLFLIVNHDSTSSHCFFLVHIFVPWSFELHSEHLCSRAQSLKVHPLVLKFGQTSRATFFDGPSRVVDALRFLEMEEDDKIWLGEQYWLIQSCGKVRSATITFRTYNLDWYRNEGDDERSVQAFCTPSLLLFPAHSISYGFQTAPPTTEPRLSRNDLSIESHASSRNDWPCSRMCGRRGPPLWSGLGDLPGWHRAW